MIITLKTLTPVHIGTGEYYDTIDYYIDDKEGKRACYFLNLPGLAKGFDRGRMSQFSKWLDARADEFSMANALADSRDRNKKLSELRKKYNMESFFRDTLRMQKGEYGKILTGRGHFRYSAPVKSKKNNRYHIRENMKFWDRSLYIPGSSIKGSLRTALGVRIINSLEPGKREELFKNALDIILKNGGKKGFRTAEEFMDRNIFCCSSSGKSQHYDLMRLITVTDTEGGGNDSAVYQVSSVTRNPEPGHREAHKLQELDAFEMIDAGSRHSFRISFNARLMKEAQAGSGDWDLFGGLFQRAFGITVPELIEKGPKEAKRTVESSCIDAMASHGMAVLKHDLAWAEKRFGASNPVYLALEKVKKSENPCTVGYATGFHGMTWYSTLAEAGSTAGRAILKEMIRFYKLDIPPKLRNSTETGKRLINDNSIASFPLSRRFVTGNDDTIIAPAGWVQIKIPAR